VSPGLNRRQFLLVGGVVAVAVTAFGSVGLPDALAGVATADGPRPSRGHDMKTAALAAGLEIVAVGAYQAALDAATAGSLGKVPPAGAAYVTTAMAHHQAHRDRWNELLQGAGAPIVTAPNATLQRTVEQRLGRMKSFRTAALLARDLEETAAATYLAAIPTLEGKDAIGLAGSIQVVDMQHVAILNFVLGEYPVPDVFARTKRAARA
jgi:Ferritin-like domain